MIESCARLAVVGECVPRGSGATAVVDESSWPLVSSFSCEEV
jgi:hypothetical protein